MSSVLQFCEEDQDSAACRRERRGRIGLILIAVGGPPMGIALVVAHRRRQRRLFAFRPPDPGAPTGGAGRLVVNTAGPRWHPGKLTGRGPSAPYLSINGQPAMALNHWRPTTVDLRPGHYHLTIGMGYFPGRLFAYGNAHLAVTVLPGQTTAVYYSAPGLPWMRGAIGPTPQAVPGRIQRLILETALMVLLLAPAYLVLLF